MKLSPTLKASYQAAAERYHRNVSLARTYLAGRGLWDEHVVRTFLLGVIDDPLPEHEGLVGRLSIPYLTPNGVVNLKFRCMEDHSCKDVEGHRKYMGLPGAEDRVFNVQALHDAEDVVYLTEGEIDALSATVAGFPAVGISGATKWRPHYVKLLEDFREVVMLADGDDAGREFAKHVKGELGNVRVVYMPNGQDVNSFLAERDLGDFEALVSGTVATPDLQR